MLSKCQLVLAVAQDLTMQWSTLGGFMQELSLMVIDEGQQYGTDREIAVISLLRQQPLVLWTGDSEQTPGGIDRAAPNAKRSRQLLLAKKHGLRSDRNYYMPSNLADAMIRLFDGSSNEGLTTLSQILRRGQHTLGQLWANQLSPQSAEDLEAANAVLPGLRAQFEAAASHMSKDNSPQSWTPNYWQAQQSTFHGPWYALPGSCNMPRPSYPWLVTYKQR